MTGVFTDTEPRKLGKAIRTLDSEVGPLDVHRIPGWLACEKWDGLPTGYEEFVVATRVERETDLPLRVTHA